MTVVHEPVGIGLVREVEGVVAALCGVSPAEIGARDRRLHVVRARWLCWDVLSGMGWSPMALSRAVGYDHGTICYGLARVRGEEVGELRLLIRGYYGLSGERERISLGLSLRLEGLGATDRAAVVAWVSCSVLGWCRRSGALCAWGLWLVWSRPEVRAAVESVVGVVVPGLSGRIELQAWRAGLCGMGGR